MGSYDDSKVNLRRKFVKAWLTDERYKFWIREVTSDKSLYHCNICNKDFSCSSSHVSRHADSACHKNSVKEAATGTKREREKPKYKKSFRQQWLDIPEFRSWLREVPSDIDSAYCRICEKSIAGGLSQLYRHAKSKVHIHKSQESNNLANESDEDLNTESNKPLSSFDERKKSAEIRYAALITDKNIPHHTAKEILHFFQFIGENSNVLKNMSMGQTKCKNIIANVLFRVETERIISNLQKTQFSIFIDEASNITNEERMTFLVRYVDSETLDVQTQLAKFIDINARDSSENKLFNTFHSEMCKLNIPFSNILSMLCNNANDLASKHCSFQHKLKENCKKLLVFSCPCYSAVAISHAASAKMPVFCENFLKKIVHYINSNPKRSAIFNKFCESFEETNSKFLKLRDTRWLSSYSCIDKILESWESIKYFLQETSAVGEKTKPKELLILMNNIDTKAYFLFLKYVLKFFNTFITFFQTHETKIHLLHSKSVDLRRQISQNFLKPELLGYKNVDFTNQENHKRINEINLGSECEEYLHKLVKEGHANIIPIIRQNCLKFYILAAAEITKKLPVSNIFLCKLQVFESHTALLNGNRETSFNDVCFIAKTLLGEFNVNDLKREWIILYNDFNIEEKQNFSELNFDNMWKEILKRESDNNIAKYPNLKLLVNSIRSLPHSNSDLKKIVSMLIDVKTYKRNRLSSTYINAMCVFKSALKSRGETALNMKINEKHLSLMSSETLYPTPAKKARKSLKARVSDTAGPSSSNNK